MFENNLDDLFDKTICILSTKSKRQKRSRMSKKINKKTFNQIVTKQTTDTERKKRADYIITNNNTKKNFINKADKVIKGILA